MRNLKLTFIICNILIGIVSCSSKKDKDIQTNKDTRPNIIYIMVDDMGYADLSSFGRTDYKTPVIDAFIREGMRFNQAYAAGPLCTPTRVGLMIGRYPARNKIGLREPLLISDTIGLSTEIQI